MTRNYDMKPGYTCTNIQPYGSNTVTVTQDNKHKTGIYKAVTQGKQGTGELAMNRIGKGVAQLTWKP